MAVKRLSEGYPDGTLLGNSSSDKVGFFGKTCVTLRSAPASMAGTATSATQIAATNKITNLLKTLGIAV